MAPEEAVARLAEIVAARAEFSEDDIYAAMTEAGIPDPVADRAYKFTQTAWGRASLAGRGVQFSPDYFCFDRRGEVVESGLLAEQPYFMAAVELARRYAQSPGFARLAQMSADASAVNSALGAGSKPENLSLGPAALFVESPTPAGIDKAQQLLARHAATHPARGPKRRAVAAASGDKPWWQFWG